MISATWDRKRVWMLAAAGLIVAGAVSVTAYLMVGGSQAKASNAELFGDMVATLQSDPGKVAAYVNGQPIPASKVEAYLVYYRSGESLGGGVDMHKTPAQYLDSLINDEVMYQVAVKDGFAPTDAEVQQVASAQKASLEAALKQGGAQAQHIQAMLDEAAGTPYGLDSYDSSPQMLAAVREQLTVGKLDDQIVSKLSAADQHDPAKRQDALDAFAAQARTAATVKVVMTLPG